MGSDARALKLVVLLFGIAFGDHDEAVTSGEVSEGLGHVGEELDLLIGDGLGEAFDATMLFVGEGFVG